MKLNLAINEEKIFGESRNVQVSYIINFLNCHRKICNQLLQIVMVIKY